MELDNSSFSACGDARGYGAENSRCCTGECTRPRPAGVSGTFKFLALRVRGRTRVRSSPPREDQKLHNPPLATRGSFKKSASGGRERLAALSERVYRRDDERDGAGAELVLGEEADLRRLGLRMLQRLVEAFREHRLRARQGRYSPSPSSRRGVCIPRGTPCPTIVGFFTM